MSLQTTLALPLALDREQIDVWLAPVQTGPVAVFLDYDGTLTPIVARPDEAALSDAMRDTVQRLAARCPVTIVTGRDISVVRAFVALDVLGYAGNHGLDIVGPPGSHARGRREEIRDCPAGGAPCPLRRERRVIDMRGSGEIEIQTQNP